MRTFAATLTVLLSFAAFAQEKSNSFFAFISDPQYVWSESHGSDFNAGYGVAVQHMFSPRWSAEVSVSHRSSRTTGTFFDANGNVIDTVTFRAKTTPVDVLAQYQFVNGSSWKPYLGGGYTHVFVDSGSTPQRDENYFTLNGGVVWRLRPAFGIRFDGKALLGDRPSYIHGSNLSVGAVWRF